MRKMSSKKQVLEKVPFSETTLWRRISAGDFPQPVQLSPNKIGFFDDELEVWQEQRPRGMAELPENLKKREA